MWLRLLAAGASLALDHGLWGVWAQDLGFLGSRAADSVVVVHGACLLRGTGDLPQPGIEPLSPALQGGLLTTGQPGMPVPERQRDLCGPSTLVTYEQITFGNV